ncbi:hypothetical protein A3Q56_04306 [Intoshia linei]|uniref:Uncharacterized protein n=1 Tax=Intoshia linei TaxID=1819745 RepID=A0A177B0Z2_9BILA|nr:hypothetical protein A3Q56_04306 [Intoshia linei]
MDTPASPFGYTSDLMVFGMQGEFANANIKEKLGRIAKISHSYGWPFECCDPNIPLAPSSSPIPPEIIQVQPQTSNLWKYKLTRCQSAYDSKQSNFEEYVKYRIPKTPKPKSARNVKPTLINMNKRVRINCASTHVPVRLIENGKIEHHSEYIESKKKNTSRNEKKFHLSLIKIALPETTKNYRKLSVYTPTTYRKNQTTSKINSGQMHFVLLPEIMKKIRIE